MTDCGPGYYKVINGNDRTCELCSIGECKTCVTTDDTCTSCAPDKVLEGT
jgi:hypothetical protein